MQYLDAPEVDKVGISRRVAANARAYLQAKVSVEYVSKLESEANTAAWVSWKAARIVDRRQDGLLEDADQLEKDEAIKLPDDVKRIHDETI